MPRRSREDENLSKPNMLKVIKLLEQEKPITKKEACERLNISYNTTRLKKLIEEFKTKEENSKKRRAKLRGKPLTSDEYGLIAQEYLNGESLAGISELIYRPVTLIKKAIEELGIPERNADHSYHNPPLLEDHSIREDYKKDDLVYSARYCEAALIDNKLDGPDGPIYGIYVLGNYQCCAVQPFWELADLTRLQEEFGIKISASPGIPPSYNPR